MPIKQSTGKMSKTNPEEEYFKRQELQKIATLRAEKAKENTAQALLDQKELHYNRCGRCGENMQPKAFKGVEIDICPSCGAVLLDPGELETLAGEDQSGILDNIASLFRFNKADD
jgi:Zn-finger nucleic acid-binding protein